MDKALRVAAAVPYYFVRGAWNLHLTELCFFRRTLMSFGLYLAGAVVVVIGLIYGATLMHIPSHWIIVMGLVAVGMAILGGVQNTRMKDPS